MKLKEKIRRAKLFTRGFTDDEARQLCSRRGVADARLRLFLMYGDYASPKQVTFHPVHWEGRMWNLIRRGARDATMVERGP